MPARLETKASRLPSGDQVGELSMAGSLVSRRGADPSALATQTSLLPSREAVKAMWRPSGE